MRALFVFRSIFVLIIAAAAASAQDAHAGSATPLKDLVEEAGKLSPQVIAAEQALWLTRS